MNETRRKKFDCLEYKRKAQAKIYEETKNMTAEEEIEYFRKGAEKGPLGDWWKSLKKSHQKKVG